MMDESLLQQFSKYFTAPVQIICLIAVAYAIKKIFFKPKEEEPEPEPQEQLEKMKKRDFTLEELKIYDGKISKDYDGQRILVGVNSKVFDVTRGRHFYGPEGPYGVFAGKDASRGLATFSVDGAVLKEEYDDLSDLNSMQLDSLREWEMQFTERYDYIGRLLKPGEKARNYDQESETEDDESKSSQKKND